MKYAKSKEVASDNMLYKVCTSCSHRAQQKASLSCPALTRALTQ